MMEKGERAQTNTEQRGSTSDFYKSGRKERKGKMVMKNKGRRKMIMNKGGGKHGAFHRRRSSCSSLCRMTRRDQDQQRWGDG